MAHLAIDSTERRTLREHFLKLRPDQPIKPSNFWVAVLKAGLKLSSSNAEEDFLWIKCPGKTKVGIIRDQYQLKNPSDGKVELKIGTPLADDEIIRALDQFKDQLIVFEAVKASDSSSHTSHSRSPLRPLDNNQLRSLLPANHISPSVKNEAETPNIAAKVDSQDQKCEPQTGRPVPAILPHPAPALMPLTPSTARVIAYVPKDGTSTGGSPTGGTPTSGTPTSGIPTAGMSIRPDWATSNGFSFYVTQNRAKLERKMDHLSSEQIQRVLYDSWLKMSPEFRQSFEDLAKQSSSNPDVILAPIKNELTIKDLLPVDQSTIEPIENENRSGESFQLQKLLIDATPELLEKGVEEGVRLLDTLKGQMLTDASTDAMQWVQQIDALRGQAVKTRTVIGVVGNTGAGKSSVINAMLDEERLLPTNCMRACTAVVTEVSYNEGTKPYRATIEFIKPADWEKELKTLFQDLVDGSGNVSRESSNPDTDAGIAYAKIKAVYPRKTKETMPHSSIDKMLEEVSHVLGTSRNIEETDSLRFYQKLQQFVDSKEKSTGDKEKDKKKKLIEMEFWPLIRVVKIFVKSAALSTGAVIVDLPGVHDSNAARAAVAENYMKECTGLWIVAPINRAVDDKAAKSLLGESFKRQLKMDGGFSTVSFICSKTDDISLTEAQEALDLNEEMTQSWSEKDEFDMKIESLQRELDALKESRIVYDEFYNDADDQVEEWESLRSFVEDGKTCFAPRVKSLTKKRKGTTSNRAPARKKQRRSRDDDSFDENTEDSEASVDSSEDNSEDSSAEEEPREPLTEEQVNAKLTELRETKRDARMQKAELTDKMTSIRKEISEAQMARKEIEARMFALCISGRNQYSKGAIQHDFAAGIRELDQEIAADEDEENFDPENELRDYDEVARSLPVFCVSSRGYQKLQGRFRKDPNVPGFETLEETEIPQLQAHCKQLTGKGRTVNCQRFINNLSQLLNSLAIWASNDGTGTNMTPEQKAREERYLQKGLKELERGLEKVVQATHRDLHEELKQNIFDKYESAIAAAEGQASQTASKWGSPVNREDRAAGGYCWSTYKAICRRMGVYSNAQGPHEWNRDLIEPMMKFLVSGWEKTFSRRLPAVMAVFTREISKLLKEFHADVNSRASKVGAGVAGLRMLQQQLQVYESIVKDLATAVQGTINTTQKDINREFTPVIEKSMAAAYDACVAEAGPGSYARMKAAMIAHVKQERHVMFQQSADEAYRLLMKMIQQAKETMSDRVDEVFVAMRRDYRSVLGGEETQGEVLPKSQRLLRKQVMTTLDGVEELFNIVLTQAPDHEGVTNEKSINLGELTASRNFKTNAAADQNLSADDMADRQLKLEDGKCHDVLLPHVAESSSRVEDELVPNDPAVMNKPPVSSNNQETVTAETTDDHSGTIEHPSMLSHVEPQYKEGSLSDQEDFKSSESHADDQENPSE